MRQNNNYFLSNIIFGADKPVEWKNNLTRKTLIFMTLKFKYLLYFIKTSTYCSLWKEKKKKLVLTHFCFQQVGWLFCKRFLWFYSFFLFLWISKYHQQKIKLILFPTKPYTFKVSFLRCYKLENDLMY